MSEKYYREINTNKDIVKFKLQLGGILLKLNEHNFNISNIKDDITKINTKIDKHRYAISSMWINYLNLSTDYNIDYSTYTLIDYLFQDEFIKGSYLEISCNILYKYDNYNHIGLLKHRYKILDDNNKVIHEYIIVHSNSGDNAVNHLSMNDSFTVFFITKPTYKLKLNLSINKLDPNNTTSVKLKF